MKHFFVLLLQRSIAWPALAVSAFASPQAWALYSCSVSASSSGVLYLGLLPAPQDSQGNARLTCTRASADPATLSYRLKADDGLQASSSQRRVRLGATANHLNFSLAHSAVCQNASTWYAPATGSSNVVTGTLNFGAALSQVADISYCFRIRSGGANETTPTAGIYTDSIRIFGQFPDNDAGALTAAAPITYSVGVDNQCVFNSFPAAMAFNYSSFSVVPQVASQSFNLQCSNSLPWTAVVSPATATVLGLTYSVTVSPSSAIGIGLNQFIALSATMPANQAGTCSSGTCTATQTHTVTISY